MKENQIKKALDEIEPEEGAQERMYANILKKAAARQKDPALAEGKAEMDQAPQTRRAVPAWRRWGGLAACLALVVIAAGLLLPRFLDRSGPNGPGESNLPPVLGGSPFEDVSGPEGFGKLDLSIDAPEGAEEVSYCIIDGEVAQVRFSVDGCQYTYRAARLDGDFSGVSGEPVGSISVDARYNAVLERLSPDRWRGHWSCGGVSYYLTNYGSVSEEDIRDVAEELLEQLS